MAKYQIKPGATIEVATPEEIAELIQPAEQVSRIRVAEAMGLDSNGNGEFSIYLCPAAMKFQVRRVAFSLTGNVPKDPNSNNVPLNVAGHFVAYLRSGSLIEYGQPQYGSVIQVPGVQTWGSQQGPEIQNMETFDVFVIGLTASVNLSVYLEGILSGPRSG